jgi:hypothetical protein
MIGRARRDLHDPVELTRSRGLPERRVARSASGLLVSLNMAAI